MAITIQNVRFSYCNLFQPRAPFNNPTGEPKYSATILVPKSDARAKAAIDQAIAQVADAAVSSKWGGVRPPQPAICIHDGDGPRPSDGAAYGAECRGHWVFTASSKEKPFVVDTQVNPIIDPTQVYSGMWGNVCVTFYAYNSAGKKGIGCGLNGVQKVRDGEPLNGRVTAEQAFAAVAAAPASAQPAYNAVPAYGAVPAQPAYQAAPNFGYAPAPDYSAAAAQTGVNPFTGEPW